MSRVSRLLELLIKLQARPRFTVQELADEFGVSRRTMLRDLHALSEMGVPLFSTPGPGGGYELLPGRRLLPLALSVEEAIGVVLSYEAFLQYAQSPFAAQSLSAVTKLRASLPPATLEELDRIRRHVVVRGAERRVEAPLLAELLAAATAHCHLRIAYESRSGVGERVIFPYGLYAAQGFWYCACFDYGRRAHVSLRVDRCRSAERVESCEPAPAMTLREWLNRPYVDKEPALRLRVSVGERGMKSFEIQSLLGQLPLDEQGRGVVDMQIPASEVAFYADLFVGLGKDAVVLAPAELIDAIRQKAREAAELYGLEMTAEAGAPAS